MRFAGLYFSPICDIFGRLVSPGPHFASFYLILTHRNLINMETQFFSIFQQFKLINGKLSKMQRLESVWRNYRNKITPLKMLVEAVHRPARCTVRLVHRPARAPSGSLKSCTVRRGGDLKLLKYAAYCMLVKIMEYRGFHIANIWYWTMHICLGSNHIRL